MNTEIVTLRSKLPKKGYLQLVKKYTRVKGKKAHITNDMIYNFFQGRKVNPTAQVTIIKATKKAITAHKKAQQHLKNLMILK